MTHSFRQITSSTFEINHVLLSSVLCRHGDFSGVGPVVSTNVTGKSNAFEECVPWTPGSPGPACAAHNGEMVQSESNPRKYESHQRSYDDIKRMVAEVKPARRRDEESYRQWHKCDDDHVHRRGRPLGAN